MPLSDPDLEARLRNHLRARADDVPPARGDLARVTRARFRAERRRRLTAAAAGLAVLVVVGVVQVTGSGVLPWSRQSAVPSDGRSLYDLPVRGGLASDGAWLRAVADLPWESDSRPVPGRQSSRESRRVVYADDVPGGRVALVVGRVRGVTLATWVTGPEGAAPDGMSVLPDSIPIEDGEAVGLLDVGPGGPAENVLAVVGFPGQRFRFSNGHVADAAGRLSLAWQSLSPEDGVAVSVVPGRHAGDEQTRLRDVDGDDVALLSTERFSAYIPRMPEPADPRGLRDRVDDGELQFILDYLVGYYTEPAEAVDPVLLWAGPMGSGSGESGALIGITLPSGATAAGMVTYRAFDGTNPSSNQHTGGMSGGMAPMPAGKGLLERLIAVYSWNSVIVSGPEAGTVAEIVRGAAVVNTFPLVDGAGTGPCPDDLAVTVRVRNAAGAVVGETPLSRTVD
jgi:hypothetical protein